MNDTVETLIRQNADRIRSMIQGGRLYGQPLDITNEDHLLIAAFEAGKREAQIAHEQDLKDIESW